MYKGHNVLKHFMILSLVDKQNYKTIVNAINCIRICTYLFARPTFCY